ncbi:Fanconi anemia core complex-associated protein 20 isoform X2 [Betta splendens]|uniref:Fanconi anemia core complex-associated protein 20 isoform X2 n=1 Tax=Betta splendens TaxID=158456 RepID=A0A9W2XXW1_BETSP|nr:Fanconi anemia core complex-associated protein 20 isoform X2 [Betta splendens]
MHHSVSPAAPWWKREQLPAAERLWMLTLRSALPYLDNQHWDLVPDFPQPSTIKPTALKLEEQRWCDLNEEVSPFPEPAPLRLQSSQQDLSVHTKPVPDPPDRQQSLHSRESHDGKTTTTTLQSLAKKTRPSLHCWETAAPPVGSSNVGSEAGRKGGEQGEPQAVTVNRQLHTNEMKMSDSRVSLQKGSENKKVVVMEDKAAEEVQDGGGGLQSCPMCLMVFPVGFTQMDCDGHLAQCLSEMDVDLTW